MEQYVINGYTQVESSLPADVHHAAHENTKRAFCEAASMDDDRRLNPANNILPMVPELQEVLDDPAVTGALTSIFGDNYLIHPHRHCHPNFPVADDVPRRTIMGIHKDGHADGNPKPRHRVPRWGLVFYNPHPCPQELGPTCITPQSHVYHRITNGGERERHVPVTGNGKLMTLPTNYVNRDFMPVVGNLGTVSILHFDMVHSVITNIGDMARYAHKFVVMRTEDPEAPSWDGGRSPWAEGEDRAPRVHAGYWRYLWNWLRGESAASAKGPAPSRDVDALMKGLASSDAAERRASAEELGGHGAEAETAVPELVRALYSDDDALRVDACYALAAIGPPAIGALADAARADGAFYEEQPILNVSEAIHALIAVGTPAIDVLVGELTSSAEHMRAWSAFALGEIGSNEESVVGALVIASRDESEPVSKHALSALGIVGRGSAAAEARLLEALSGEDRDKRVYAVQGLIRINASSGAAIDALERALSDPHPYVGAFAHELLYRVGGPDARDALLRYLRPLRWFPYPTRKATAPAY